MIVWLQQMQSPLAGSSTKEATIIRKGGRSVAFENAFPWDIMAQILDHAIRVYHEGTTSKFIGSPHVLSQVCKDWQSYIASKPRFWSSIIISLHRAERWRNIYISGLEDSVKRAGALPLDVYLDAEAGLYNVGIRPTTEDTICRFMVDSWSKWGSLDSSPVHWSFASVFHTLLNSTNLYRITAGLRPLNYPPLCSYVVRGTPGPNEVSLLTNLESIPCLKSLQMAHYDDYLPFLRYKADTITNVSVTTDHVLPTHEVLLSFPEAETIDITYLGCGPPPLHIYDGKVVKSSRLRSIKIATEMDSDIMHLLNRLKTANLEDLHLYSCDVTQHADAPFYILKSIPLIGCQLRCLSLQLVIPNEGRLIHMMRTLPSLEALHIHHVEAHKPFNYFKGLTQAFFNQLHPESSFRLPKLKTLSYVGPLAIESLERLNSLVLRMNHDRTLRSESDPSNPASIASARLLQPKVVRLKFVKIVTDQKWPLFGPIDADRDSGPFKLVKPRPPSLAKAQKNVFVPAELLEEMRSLVDRNALWLLNADGSEWK